MRIVGVLWMRVVTLNEFVGLVVDINGGVFIDLGGWS